MDIRQVKLKTADVTRLHDFYAVVLGLPCVPSGTHLSIQIGTGTLTYEEDIAFTGFYHLAFEIPSNQADEAQQWLSQRLVLLTDAEGKHRFDPSETWNTTNLYFADPAGNILELVARHDRPTDQRRPFSPAHLLNVSEVGLVVNDVTATVRHLEERYGLRPFNGQSPTFTAVGGHDGMLIVVPAERGWFPTSQPAVIAPLTVGYASGVVTAGRIEQITLP